MNEKGQHVNVCQPKEEKLVIKQTELIVKYIDLMKSRGHLYQKIKGVYARVAGGGEKIITRTSDGMETMNVANKGDYIVTNTTTSKESYIIKPAQFAKKYTLHHDDYFVPNENAQVFALQLTENTINKFKLEAFTELCNKHAHKAYIEAPWYERQAVKLNDYLASPLIKNEVYRIANKEFLESYKLIR